MASQVLSPLKGDLQDPAFRLGPFRQPRDDALQRHQGLFASHRSYPNSTGFSRSVQQFALPVRSRTRSGGPSKPYALQLRTPNNEEENFLRRKTPNGTLNGAYDGSEFEPGAQPPASKHLLVPGSHTTHHKSSLGVNRRFGNGADGVHTQCGPFSFTNNSTNPQGFRVSQPSPWPASNSRPWPQVDSVLNGVSNSGHLMDWQPTGQYAPNVMQPPFQTPLGPTVSNEPGIHGPYWQNVPFPLHNSGPSPIDYHYGARAFRAPGSQSDVFQSLQNHNYYSQPTSVETSNTFFGNTQQVPSCIHGALQFCTVCHTAPNSAQASSGHRPSLDPEGILDYGFTSYKQLTSAITQARKQEAAGLQSSRIANSNLPLANIFPEPLRWRGPHDFRSFDAVGQWGNGLHYSTSAKPTAVTASKALSNTKQHGSWQMPQGFNGSNIDCHQFSAHSSTHLPYHASQQVTGNPFWPSESPARTAATEALNIITDICQQSMPKWTDGMLLAGCLAYALGDFQKSLHWNSHILELEPNHVEATSNMAATYLALNYRQEAEQYWRMAISLRPEYFDAIEHLVGLLCHDRRNKEAVKIIEQFQTSLNSNQYNYASINKYDLWCADVGHIINLLHAKGNLLYNMQDHAGAAKSFEDVVLIAVGCHFTCIDQLIGSIITALSNFRQDIVDDPQQALLLPPEKAVQTVKLCFPDRGELPGLAYITGPSARKGAMSVVSNSLLSLAKIFQDEMNPHTNSSPSLRSKNYRVKDILALYYLSLSLQPSPSTANNVGILLAGVHTPVPKSSKTGASNEYFLFTGVLPGSGVALALMYYKYGLSLDSNHAHLFTNLGSLLKDIGQLPMAISMYEKAVLCDPQFDIALANLANAVKDQGRISDAIYYYKQAVSVNANFAEAVCGLANALNSVCDWAGRGGVFFERKQLDRWHVDDGRNLYDSRNNQCKAGGWMQRTVDIADSQLREGQAWGIGCLSDKYIDSLSTQLATIENSISGCKNLFNKITNLMRSWKGRSWEGAKVMWLIERAVRRLGWKWYQEKFVRPEISSGSNYVRPMLPASLSTPAAPTVLPFHTFTLPMNAKQIRRISQRNGLRVSCTTMRASWLPPTVFPPPSPPSPEIKVGYVSSDFNNHPLAHLMQSVFGMHDRTRVLAYCYATTSSDGSTHRQQIEREAPFFCDAGNWSVERLVNQIVEDGIHVLVNLNGYTRGARNEIFAARPAPIQMSFMGFAGTLGAEWCDYLLADETAVPPETMRPYRRNVDVEDVFRNENSGGGREDWIYAENIIYSRDSFFCCDHKQSAPDAKDPKPSWEDEQARRWRMRKELFPDIPDDAIIFGNFNQLYKIDPTTFRTWLRILHHVPNSYLWLLRFPADGASNLLTTANKWAGPTVASRIRFTDVAPKGVHITRACIADLFLDTPECNAHTTAADCLWSGTPLLTLPRYEWKMCSRMAAGILGGAFDRDTVEGRKAWEELVTESEEEYEGVAIRLGRNMQYDTTGPPGSTNVPMGRGRLMDLRKMIWEGKWTCKLFDTKRWVSDLELAYQEAWKRWVNGESGDIWLKNL